VAAIVAELNRIVGPVLGAGPGHIPLTTARTW
jgi:hypothetical protein